MSSPDEILKRLEFLEHKLGVHYLPEADKALEALLEAMEPLKLQNLLREIDAKDLVLALVGMGPKALAQVKAAMSKKSWEMMKEEVAFHLRQGVSEMAAHEARMLVMGLAAKIEEGKSAPGRQVEGLEEWKTKVFDKLD